MRDSKDSGTSLLLAYREGEECVSERALLGKEGALKDVKALLAGMLGVTSPCCSPGMLDSVASSVIATLNVCVIWILCLIACAFK